MLRSTYCCLNEHSDKELTDLGECPYDQASAPPRAVVAASGRRPPQIQPSIADQAVQQTIAIVIECITRISLSKLQDDLLPRSKQI